jgi:drug/metabolite transporter (DMT)-like permease
MPDNPRAILLMVLAMAAFAIEDMFIKLTAPALPQGIGGFLAMAVLARRSGLALVQPAFLHPAVLGRNLTEMIGSGGFVLAITMAPLTAANAVFQAMPLAVTAGAALFLGEKVGWRRWLAVGVGLSGVLIVIRPGPEGLTPGLLWALVAVVGLTARDLFTRVCPQDLPPVVLAAWGYVAVTALGVMMLAVTGGAVWPDAHQALMLGGAILTGTTGYLWLTQSLRLGELSAVMPFRYFRLVCAIGIGWAVFGDRLDGVTWIGIALIIGAGLYAILRERTLSKSGALR